MNTLKTNTNLTIKLLTTNKAFICYNLTDDKAQIDSFVLTEPRALAKWHSLC